MASGHTQRNTASRIHSTIRRRLKKITARNTLMLSLLKMEIDLAPAKRIP
jgi:hypothetical protein